ncbi:H-type lectin domain protein (macronuclear) [Tetrahymena thermophila SB210]|uniref:H-type lectin domain protein n=1 Tax=Tetrahymena thermophila (strain SB210) TaxID=312017 RepID=Q23C28_TETTS|nr:H-type lectin domain protein [Tetrahymena thermophila SB210]EAR93940.2 H-type lectin domain protein [Tetrahymena thermophila SB210]|eukprot:XP_001014185.2 H-type lectin domain protein [Tetrahymena thermophila SB210]
MYVQMLKDTLSQGDSITKTFSFPKPFQNIPKAILNIQSYHTNINFSQSFKLFIQNITLTSITIKLQSLDTTIYELKIGILAVDYPFVDVFNNTLTQKQIAVHKVENKIQSYVTFFTSFQASSCVFLEFNLDSSQKDDYSIEVKASEFNCLNSLDYNLLIIYYNSTNFPDMKFYYYQHTAFSDNINSNTLVKTNLTSPDTGFYGIKDMKIGSLLSFGIFFNPKDENQPIQNGNYDFFTDKKKYIIYNANSQVFDLIKLECPSGQYLYKESCILQPKNGIYCQNNPNVCFDCDSKCVACEKSATNCLKCVSPLYFYQNKCFNDIQTGTYCDESNICHTCNLLACSSCVGNADFCTTCINGYHFYNNSCTQNQPNQTYCKFNTTLNYYECFPCDKKCNKCSGPLQNQCSECVDYMYFYQQSCTPEQPNQTVCTNYICQQCFNLCKSCFGVNQNQCVSCISNYQLNPNTNQCEISICQDGYYPDKLLNSCQKCKKGCDKCIQFSVCTECSTIANSQGVVQTYILDEKLQVCILNCLEGQYLDFQTNECSACDKSCLTCNGKTNQNCLSCINGARINSQGICQCQKENEGFSDDFKYCIQCQIKNCNKCFYSNSCESCSELASLNPEKNQCICEDGYFYSDSYKKCIKCIQSSCLTCLSDGITCTKCQSGFLKTEQSICTYCNNYKYSSDGKSCDSKCPSLCEVILIQFLINYVTIHARHVQAQLNMIVYSALLQLVIIIIKKESVNVFQDIQNQVNKTAVRLNKFNHLSKIWLIIQTKFFALSNQGLFFQILVHPQPTLIKYSNFQETIFFPNLFLIKLTKTKNNKVKMTRVK